MILSVTKPFFPRTFNQTKNTLISRLNECKLGSCFDPDLMRETEKQLNKIIDLEVKNEFKKLCNFKLLNSEKITPYFIKMAKCARSEFTLSEIKNDRDFRSRQKKKLTTIQV